MSTTTSYTADELMVARVRLSGFVERMANQMRERHGGVWFCPVQNAPVTLGEMLLAMKNARRPYAAPFPVWEGASDKTIYITPYHNHCFRFWHDCLHIMVCAETDTPSELELGAVHTGCAMAEFGVDSLEAKLMRADTIGQTRYHEVNGEFPVDQLHFAELLIEKGMV